MRHKLRESPLRSRVHHSLEVSDCAGHTSLRSMRHLIFPGIRARRAAVASRPDCFSHPPLTSKATFRWAEAPPLIAPDHTVNGVVAQELRINNCRPCRFFCQAASGQCLTCAASWPYVALAPLPRPKLGWQDRRRKRVCEIRIGGSTFYNKKAWKHFCRWQPPLLPS